MPRNTATAGDNETAMKRRLAIAARTEAWRTGGAIFVAAVVLAAPLIRAAAVEIQSQNGVTYTSGGVGDDEQKALNAMSDRFNLRLTLALKSGLFVSDATVRIQDAQGTTLVDTVADGPLVFAQLKPGTYTVRCTLDGKELTQTAQVTDKGQRHLAFRWSSD